MAFPTVSFCTPTNGSTASATATPAFGGTSQQGELLIAVHRSAGAGAHGYPAGWTELADNATDASDDNVSIAWAIADGSEGGGTLSITQGNVKYATVIYQIAGHDFTRPPELSAITTGTGTSVDPANLAPSIGVALDFLWIAIFTYEGEQALPTLPAGYSNQGYANSGTGGAVATNCRTVTGQKANNASSDNPGAMTISVSDDWTAYTLAVYPYDPAPVTNRLGMLRNRALPEPPYRPAIWVP